MLKLLLTGEIGLNRQVTEISLHQDFYVRAHDGVSFCYLSTITVSVILSPDEIGKKNR